MFPQIASVFMATHETTNTSRVIIKDTDGREFVARGFDGYGHEEAAREFMRRARAFQRGVYHHEVFDALNAEAQARAEA